MWGATEVLLHRVVSWALIIFYAQLFWKAKLKLAVQFKGNLATSDYISKAVLKELTGISVQESRSVLFRTSGRVLQILMTAIDLESWEKLMLEKTALILQWICLQELLSCLWTAVSNNLNHHSSLVSFLFYRERPSVFPFCFLRYRIKICSYIPISLSCPKDGMAGQPEGCFSPDQP